MHDLQVPQILGTETLGISGVHFTSNAQNLKPFWLKPFWLKSQAQASSFSSEG